MLIVENIIHVTSKKIAPKVIQSPRLKSGISVPGVSDPEISDLRFQIPDLAGNRYSKNNPAPAMIKKTKFPHAIGAVVPENTHAAMYVSHPHMSSPDRKAAAKRTGSD